MQLHIITVAVGKLRMPSTRRAKNRRDSDSNVGQRRRAASQLPTGHVHWPHKPMLQAEIGTL